MPAAAPAKPSNRHASLTAAHLGADPEEIVFTSGATEANNLALFGLAGHPPAQLIASPIEHPCALEPLQQLRQRGFDLDFLPVDAGGVVRPDDLDRLLRPPTRLVAVMLANHETGALQPVRNLANVLAGRALLHCDAAAAAGKLAIDFHTLGAATLTISAHKFHGPKGVGALWSAAAPNSNRSYTAAISSKAAAGTEPVPSAVGLATALDLAMHELAERCQRVTATSLERPRAPCRPRRRQRPDHWPAAHAEPLVSGMPGRCLAHELRPRRHLLLDRLGLLQRIAPALAGVGGDGRSP